MSRILGAVLAGGRASRFGRDKALALLDGAPLIEHVARALAAQGDAVIVGGREHPGYETVADVPETGLGPLGGLAGALAYAAAGGFDFVLSAPCDVPLLPPDLVALLGGAGGACLAECPVIGLWPSRLASALEAHLRTGERRSVRGWAEAAGVELRPLGRLLVNINREDDLARLARCAAPTVIPANAGTHGTGSP